MWSVTGLLPRTSGDCVPPGKVSDSITIESPIRMRACMSFPSGTAWRASSFAPKAFLYQSMAAAAPLIARYGVTVRNHGGMGGFLDFAGLLAFAFLYLYLGMFGDSDDVV